MIITDLNYLETADARVLGGFDFGDSSKTKVEFKFELKSLIVSKPIVKGNAALAEAEADAIGKNTFTSATSSTFVKEGYGSSSSATSVSATSGYYYKPY